MAIGGVPVEQIQGEFDYRKIPICRYSYRPSVDMKEETIGCCMHDAAFHECITGKKWNVARNRWEASSTPVVNLVIHKFRWITDERTWIAYAWEPAPGCCNTPLPHSFVPMPTDAHLWQTVYPGLCATDGELYDETENTILRGGVTLYARPRTCEEADLLCRAQLLTTATRAVDSAPAEPHCILRPLHNWREVELNGETISMRNREKAKDFLRHLWNKDAKRRSKAIPAGRLFPKPSSLFGAGERFIPRGTGHTTVDVPVTSQLGALIRRVYREAVVCVKTKRGTGPHRYYLRAFPDSDNT
jgi:hypothetical protein